MPLQKPAPQSRPIPKVPHPTPQPIPPPLHTAIPPPPLIDPFTQLCTAVQTLVALLHRKASQPSSIYTFNATDDEILNTQIRAKIRTVKQHPYFLDIENDLSEENFYITWGRLEAESMRWRKGDVRRERGKVVREQRAVRRVLRDWGVDVGGAGKEGGKNKREKRIR